MKPSELYMQLTNRHGLYNIQVIDNIPSIMKYGLLSYAEASKLQHKSIAMPEIQERRDKIYVPGGMTLHKYVNVYFDYKNPMLYKRREENSNICILKLDVSILDIDGTVVSDRNASSDYASFALPEVGLGEIDFNLVFATDWTDDDRIVYYQKKTTKCAEVLVPYKIPFRYIQSAAVYNDESRERLKATGVNFNIYVGKQYFY